MMEFHGGKPRYYFFPDKEFHHDEVSGYFIQNKMFYSNLSRFLTWFSHNVQPVRFVSHHSI